MGNKGLTRILKDIESLVLVRGELLGWLYFSAFEPRFYL